MLLGIFTTITVAWGLAAWLPQRGWSDVEVTTRWRTLSIRGNQGSAGSDSDVLGYRLFSSESRNPVTTVTSPAVTATKISSFGASRQIWFSWLQLRRASPVFGLDPAFVAKGPLPQVPEFQSRRWGTVDRVLLDYDSVTDEGCEHATGWPMLAGWYSIVPIRTKGAAPSCRIEGGIAFGAAPPTATAVTSWQIRALPYRPIWTGFIVNAACYAGVWFIALGGIGYIRRERRRCRGRCERCAYDLTGIGFFQPCPECGCMSRYSAALRTQPLRLVPEKKTLAPEVRAISIHQSEKQSTDQRA